jgi:hypothetical protein
MFKLCVLFCLALGLGQQTQRVPQFDAPYRLEPIERFAGQLVVRTSTGTTRTVRVAIRTWGIPNRQRVTLAEQGYLIVQLISGEATTVIAGARLARKEGEFWTVAAGQELIIETANDTATLSVVSIQE